MHSQRGGQISTLVHITDQGGKSEAVSFPYSIFPYCTNQPSSSVAPCHPSELAPRAPPAPFTHSLAQGSPGPEGWGVSKPWGASEPWGWWPFSPGCMLKNLGIRELPLPPPPARGGCGGAPAWGQQPAPGTFPCCPWPGRARKRDAAAGSRWRSSFKNRNRAVTISVDIQHIWGLFF